MATEKRLIDKDALIELCDAPHWCVWMSEIEDFPTVDAVEVVHGQWKNNENDYPACTNCGYMPMYDHMIDDIYYSPYCPNCGADMRERKDND